MRAHHGVITVSEAKALGLTAGVIEGLVRRGRWEVVERGIYRVAGSPIPPEQRHRAAVLRCGEGAYLTAEAAMGLWGIPGWSLVVAPVVLVPAQRVVRGVAFQVRYRPALGPADRTTFRHVPTATRSRSLVDLAAYVRGREFRIAFDSVKRVGGTSTPRLRRSAVVALPQRGAQYAIDVADSGLLDMESEGERTFFAIMESIRPPLDVQQWLLHGVRVDFVWRDARLVVEYDGPEFHTLPTDRAHDLRRRSRLRSNGWAVTVVVKEDLRDPDALVRRLRRRRAQRLAQLRQA